MVSGLSRRRFFLDQGRVAVILIVVAGGAFACAAPHPENGTRGLQVRVNPADGQYSIAVQGSSTVALRAGIGAEVDGRWLRGANFPPHMIVQSQVDGCLGRATEWQVTYSRISGSPALIYQLMVYRDEPFGEIQVTVQNTTGKAIRVSGIRSVDATGGTGS